MTLPTSPAPTLQVTRPTPLLSLAEEALRGSSRCGVLPSLHREPKPKPRPKGLLPIHPGHGPRGVTPGQHFPAGLTTPPPPATSAALQDVKPCLFFPGSWKAHPAGLKNSSGPHRQACPQAVELQPVPQSAGRGPQEEGWAGVDTDRRGPGPPHARGSASAMQAPPAIRPSC